MKQGQVRIPRALLEEMNNLCLEALSTASLPPGVRKRFRVAVVDTHRLLHKDIAEQQELDFD